MLIPWDNRADLAEIDPIVRENLLFVPCKSAEEVLRIALCSDPVSSSSVSLDVLAEDKTAKQDILQIPHPVGEPVPATIV